MLARTFCTPASFDAFAREMDRVFEAMRSRSNVPARTSGAPLPMNVWQTDDAFVAEMEVPGFDMNGITIEATEETLSVKGQRTVTRPESAKVLRAERGDAHFERSLRLPGPINVDAVSAKLADGVLTITLPIAESRKPRRIEVK